MPSNVHYFATDRVERVEVVHAGMPVCAVYGRGYATSAVTANLARGFERDPADAVAVGVLHANVGGQPGFEPYAPCTLDDLRAARMDYWALGHIHAPRLLASDPHVRYAGCTQGLDPSEGGAHGCWFVTVSEGAVAEEFVPTDELRWAGLSVDVSGVEDIDALRTTLDAACDAERTRAEGRPVIVRIDLIGRAAVHALLARPGVLADLTGDVRERQLVEEPWVWIDRVRDLTRPEIDLDALRGSSDFLGDLVAIADDMTRDPDAVSAFVGDALEPLRGVPGAVPVDASEAADLVERARDLCLDRLLAGEER